MGRSPGERAIFLEAASESPSFACEGEPAPDPDPGAGVGGKKKLVAGVEIGCCCFYVLCGH